MTSLAGSFELTRQTRLPASAQIKVSVRDYQIVDFLLSESPPLLQRMAVLYDPDRDERILDFLTCATYACPRVRSNIIVCGESKGRITIYYGDPLTLDKAPRALSEAAYKATWPQDKWVVDIVLVPVRNGVLDRARLPETSPLLVLPERFQYGLIEVRS